MPQQTKIFRVFVSSTFSDMKTERKLLQEKVFPELEKFCRQNGARFQAIDLRWGVSEESQRDQKTMEVCLNEIKRCQQITPKPNFLILLGDRYGWQPVPAKILQTEMDMLFPFFPSEVQKLVRDWYKLDTNAIPSEYVLQPRKGAFSDYAHWKSIETDLREGLRTAAFEASFDNDALIKYTTSATHQEIIAGALNPSYGTAVPEEHVFVLSRQINNLPEDKSAANFIDLNEYGLRDEYCKTQLEGLRKVLEKKLGDNFISYSVNWNGGKKLFCEQNEFDENIFVEGIIKRLKGIIEDQLKTLVDEDELQMEIRYHKEFADSLTKDFTGRQSTLDEIQKYFNDSQNNKVLALIGASGSGKTCVMARALELAKSDYAILVARFIGANAKSSNLINLLNSICSEIAQAYGKNLQDMAEEFQKSNLFDYNALRMILPKCLALVTPDKPLLLFLDALDQLSDRDDAKSLNWLGQILPAHVHLVVSALPELESRLQDAHIIHLPLMPPAEGDALLTTWLMRSGRQLTANQMKEVLEKFKQCGLPLFLKLAFEQVWHWHSYDPVKFLANTVPEIIEQFMQTLKHEHYPTLVAKVIGYILSGRDKGLTEDEILDMLVLDAEHWQNFLQDICHPKHRQEVENANKLPVVVWSRLFLDLSPYLTERDSYGERIVAFYHRQFNEVLTQKYLGDAKTLHLKLGGYFNEQTHFFDGAEQKKPNVRKCVEQPYQQTQGEMWDEVTETLCDLDFIQAKAVAKMIYDLIKEINDVLLVIPDNSEKINAERAYQECMEKYAHDLIAYAIGDIAVLEVPESVKPWSQEKINAENNRIRTNPTNCDRLHDFRNFIGLEIDNILQNAAELPYFAVQQAWNYADSGPVGDAASCLVESKSIFGIENLLLRTRCSRPIGLPISQAIKILTGHSGIVRCISMTPDGRRAVSCSEDNAIFLWDVETGAVIRTHIEQEVSSVSMTPDGRRAVIVSRYGTLISWDLETGATVPVLKGSTYNFVSVSVMPDGYRAITGLVDGTLALWDIETGVVMKTLKGHSEPVPAVTITPNGRHAVSGSLDGSLILWNLDTGKVLKKLKGHKDGISSVSMTPDGKYAISGSPDCTLIFWDLIAGKALRTLKGHRGGVNAVTITSDGKRALSGSDDADMILWDLQTGKRFGILILDTICVTSLAMTPDGRRVVSGSYNNNLIQWDMETVRLRLTKAKSKSSILTSGVTPNTHHALSGSGDGTLVLWDIVRCTPIRTLKGHKKAVWALSVAEDSRFALSCSDDKTLILWDLLNGKPIRTMKHQSIKFKAVCVTPDGRYAVSSSKSGNAIWDLELGVVVKWLGRGRYPFSTSIQDFYGVRITPDGYIAVSPQHSKSLHLLNTKTNREHWPNRAGWHKGGVTALNITPDGRRAISGSYDKTLILSDLVTGEKMTLEGHTGWIATVSITPDGRRAVSGSFDNTLILWDLETGRKLARFTTTSFILTATVSTNCIFGGVRTGEVFILKTGRKLLCLGPGIITARHIWDFNLHRYLELSADCPYCGTRFVTNKNIVETIRAIFRSSGLGPNDSPCLSLPKECWEEPRLLSSCPKCKEALKFNPFLVDPEGISL